MMTKSQHAVAEAILAGLVKSGQDGSVNHELYWRCHNMAKNLLNEDRKLICVARFGMGANVCGLPAHLESVTSNVKVPLCEKHQP